MLETCSIVIFMYHSDILLSPSTNVLFVSRIGYKHLPNALCVNVNVVIADLIGATRPPLVCSQGKVGSIAKNEGVMYIITVTIFLRTGNVNDTMHSKTNLFQFACIPLEHNGMIVKCTSFCCHHDGMKHVFHLMKMYTI